MTNQKKTDYICISKESEGPAPDTLDETLPKQRLSELGISLWNFYDAKRKYAPKEEGDNAGEFLQLIPGGSFLPNPIKPSRSRSSKQKESAQETVAVNIELRTPTGTMMRISGNLTGRELKEIIIASSTHV